MEESVSKNCEQLSDREKTVRFISARPRLDVTVADICRFSLGMTYDQICNLAVRKGWVKDAREFEDRMREMDEEAY